MVASESLGGVLDMDVEARAGWTLVHVAGDLDYGTARFWEAGLSEPLSAGGAQVAVEVSRLTLCDTAGITCFTHAYQRAQESGARIVFLRPSEQVRRLLTITGLTEYLPIHDELPAGDGATA